METATTKTDGFEFHESSMWIQREQFRILISWFSM
jgi:hypothetical protein